MLYLCFQIVGMIVTNFAEIGPALTWRFLTYHCAQYLFIGDDQNLGGTSRFFNRRSSCCVLTRLKVVHLNNMIEPCHLLILPSLYKLFSISLSSRSFLLRYFHLSFVLQSISKNVQHSSFYLVTTFP